MVTFGLPHWTIFGENYTKMWSVTFQTDFRLNWFWNGFVLWNRWLLNPQMISNTGLLISATYWSFSIGSEVTYYMLAVSGYDGQTGGDAIDKNAKYQTWVSNRRPFSTIDRDNDMLDGGICAANGGWWYNKCSISNLNVDRFGRWLDTNQVQASKMAIARVWKCCCNLRDKCMNCPHHFLWILQSYCADM